MEIRIVEERPNPLLKRQELRFEVAHATAATPTRDTVRTELAKAVHAPKDRVIIERMEPRFGTAITRGHANVYESAEAAKSTTREHILVRNGLKEKPTKGAAPAPTTAPAAEAAKPAEAPPVPAPAAHAAPPPSSPPEAAPKAAEAPSEDAAAGSPKKAKAHPHPKKE